MGEPRRGGSSEREQTDAGADTEGTDSDGEAVVERYDGTRLARLGDRLGIDALGRLSWRRRWVGERRPWRTSASSYPEDGSLAEKGQFLVRYAVLAPSSHDTQPWRFNVSEDEIRLFADLNRWLTVADPDKRELYLSLGAALENVVVAANYFGLDAEVRYLPGSDTNHAATVQLSDGHGELGRAENRATEPRDDRLFEAIPGRRTVRGPYQKRAIPREDLQTLRDVVTESDVTLQFVVDPVKLDEIATLTSRADRRLFADPAYRRELARWMGRGAFGHSWPKAKVLAFAVRHTNVGRQQARSDARLLRNAPVVAVLRTESDDRRAQLRAGQAYQRVCLLATTLDVRTHPISALLEVPTFRRELTGLLGSSDWPPQHLFRLGYAERTPAPSPRRPANAVLVD